MIEPDRFYPPSDEPTPSARRRMWNGISSSISPATSPWLVLERRSFLLGMAASIVLVLATLGAVSAVERFLDSHRPPALRVDNAYQAAIREFETVAVQPLPTSRSETRDGSAPLQDVFRSRQEQLRSIEDGIAALRAEMTSGDVSPLKRARLRDLYAKKLIVLQDMIEQGEIAL